jgi:hypothetical protein|uniref:Uncharacterized protein n=1 Tax=Mimiviridae sp. ChoanoV1 TaxID=2596887 RepID=A0A5B8II38_9VIRU|nr:hypothetical protein 2_54 [Mimiviridae sp. ChoanoV1]
MSIDCYNLNSSDYRISVPFTIPKEEEVDKVFESYKDNPKSINAPIPETIIVDIIKMDVEYNGEKYYGINFILINLKRILKDLNLSIYKKFNFKLLNNNGIEAKYCDFLKKETKYLFHYDGNSNLIVL